MNSAFERLRAANPVTTASIAPPPDLLDRIVANSQAHREPKPRRRLLIRRAVSVVLAGAVMVPAAGAATGLFNTAPHLRSFQPQRPVSSFANAMSAYNGQSEAQAMRYLDPHARIDARSVHVAVSVRLPDGRPVQIVTGLLSGHAGACKLAVLAAKHVLIGEFPPCAVYRAAENRRAPQPIYALTGFEDLDQADIIDAHTHARVVFGLLSPGSVIARRAVEVRVDPAAPGSQTARPARVQHGAYVIVLTNFNHFNGLTPPLQALDANGHVQGSTG